MFKKPYVIYPAQNYPLKHIAYYEWEKRKTDAYIFMKGRQLPFDSGNPNTPGTMQDPKDYDLIFYAKTNATDIQKWDCLRTNFPACIINERAIAVLKDLCPDNFQVFDALIQAKDKTLTNYKVLNITKTINAIDLENSDYEGDEELGIKIFHINKLRFIENCVGDAHIARAKHQMSLELVSDDLEEPFCVKRLRDGVF